METEALDRVVKETLLAIEKGKEAIFDIAENARSELERVRKELMETKHETLETIHQVDRYIQLEKQARLRLMEVSRDFHRYSEDVVKEAYERARDIQIQLFVLQEKEKNLRRRRDELERSLQRLTHTVEKAEILITQIGVVLQFLQGTLREITVKLDGLQQKQQIGLKIIQAQEEERRRIAREIHDGPAQSLANLVLRVELCEQLLNRDPGRVKPELERLKDSVRNTLKDIRKIIFDLRPMSLDDLGLVGGLRRFFGDFQERYGLPVDLLVFGQEKGLDEMCSIAIFRIIQEALNNVVKHARASRVSVKLEFLPQHLAIAVNDDGVGFDPQSLEQDDGHYGLLNMQERARLLNGKLEIRSAPGRGTEIRVMIPVEREGDEVGGN